MPPNITVSLIVIALVKIKSLFILLSILYYIVLYPWPQIADGTTDRLKRLLAASSVLVFSVPRRQIVQSFKLKYWIWWNRGWKESKNPSFSKRKEKRIWILEHQEKQVHGFLLEKGSFFSGLVGETCPSFMYTWSINSWAAMGNWDWSSSNYNPKIRKRPRPSLPCRLELTCFINVLHCYVNLIELYQYISYSLNWELN